MAAGRVEPNSAANRILPFNVSERICEGVLNIALFIIGCTAIHGHLLGIVAGACVVGLAIPLLLGSIYMGVGNRTSKERQIAAANIILMIAMVIIGALSIAGVLPSVTLGWLVVAPTLIICALSCMRGCYIGCMRNFLGLPERQIEVR